jgi:hypothetical protein
MATATPLSLYLPSLSGQCACFYATYFLHHAGVITPQELSGHVRHTSPPQ